ncbi:MAG TPA: TolC family protein [Armatimonadota bacterium]
MNKLIPLFCLSILFCRTSAAGQGAFPDRLSLKDAVNLALESNFSLKASEASKLDSLSNLQQQSILTTYGLGVSSSVDRNSNDENVSGQVFGSLEYSGLGGTTSAVSLYPFGTGSQRSGVVFSLSRPLLKGSGRNSTKYDALQSARSSTYIQNKQLYGTEQSTVLNVIATYYQAVLAAEQVKIKERAVTLAEQSAEYVRRRVDEGLERGILVTQQEVYVAQARDALNLARQSARGAVDNLMIAMGLGVGQLPTLTDPIPDSSTEMPDLAKAIDTAIENRVELAVYDENLSETERKLAIRNDQLRPDLNVVASLSSSNSGSGFINSDFISSGASAVGLVYKFPIDKRIAAEDRNITARALDTLRRQRAFSSEQIVNDVRTAYRSLDTARVSLGIYTQSLDTAKENLRIAQRMVEEGEGDSLSVVEAQKNLADNESNIAGAKMTLFLARKQLEYAMGENLTSMVVK